MVHKLRSRDVCHTSPRPSQIQGDMYGDRQRIVSHSTPNNYQRKQENINRRIKNLQISMLENVSQVEHLQSRMLSQRREEIVNEVSSIDNLNITKYQSKLLNLVDECIFSQTFNKRSGVSLYTIKKSMKEDHSFNPSRFSKPVSQYIASSIAAGKLCQITGHGASGTFRFNRTIHKNYVRQLRKLRKVSSQSHTIQRRLKKQTKRNTSC